MSGDLRLSCFFQSGEYDMGNAWFRVFLLSLFLSLSLSLFLSVSVCLSLSELEFLVCGCRLSSFEKFVFYIVFFFLIGSDWVFFVSYREGHGLPEKLLLIIFIF